MPPAHASTGGSSLAERYGLLLDIARTLTGTLSQDDVYRVLYRQTARVLEAAGFYVSLYDADRDLATIVFYADQGEERRVAITYRGSDSEVIRTGRPSLVEDRLENRSLLVLGAEGSDVTRSAISAPLRTQGHVLGSISAQSYSAGAYTPDDLELLQAIADHAAVVIENALHVAELERQRKEAEQIEEIGRALAGSLDRHDLLQKVVDAAQRVTAADGAMVWLREGGTRAVVAASAGEAWVPMGVEWDLEGELFERLVSDRAPVVIDDLEDSPLVPEPLRPHLSSGSGVSVPLMVGTQVAGALSAGSGTPRFFTGEDTRLLRRLASQAAVALQNARLHASLQALSLTDPLTGLPNRRQMQIHLEREVAAAQRGREVVLVIHDLDNFKGFNDTRGHLAGDDALRAFAQILDDENRAMNLVARYGGDEFISILSESSIEGARHYTHRLDERVEEDPILGPAGITVSCGIARFDPATMVEPSDLIQAADAELYARKGMRLSP